MAHWLQKTAAYVSIANDALDIQGKKCSMSQEQREKTVDFLQHVERQLNHNVGDENQTFFGMKMGLSSGDIYNQQIANLVGSIAVDLADASTCSSKPIGQEHICTTEGAFVNSDMLCTGGH